MEISIRLGQRMWQLSWQAAFPDADVFLRLLYGPSIGRINYACYESLAFDRAMDQIVRMPDSPERTKLITGMVRQFEADTPWKLGVGPYANVLVQPWVLGYKRHPFLWQEWMYLDLKSSRQ